MTTNNQYYKTIYEKVVGTSVTGHHTDNYYLKGIAEKLCKTTYTDSKCNGKYLKDIAESQTDKTYSMNHFNNFYLHEWAEVVVGEELPMDFDNQLLAIIADNVIVSSVITLEIPSVSVIDSTVELKATAFDKNKDPYNNLEITFEIDGDVIGAANTNSNGVATYPYVATDLGTFTITAKNVAEELTVSKTLTVNKHTSEFIGVIIAPSNINVGDNYTVMGNLEIDGTVASGKTINIYNDDTVVGSTTTLSNGAFRFDSDPLSSSGKLHIKAVFETDAKHTGCESDTQTILVDKKTPSLTINTPVITYEDEFSVTGVLKDGNIGIPNATVKLEWSETGGQTQVVEGTTGNGGAVTFSRSAPTTITNYTFKLVYDGNNQYNTVNSSTINVGVGKETTVMTLNSPVSGAVMYADGSMNVRGELVDNDSTPNPVTNATVVAKIGNAVVGSYTTNNNGVFSGVLKGDSLDIGYNTVDFVFEETAEYLGSSQTGLSIRVIKGDTLSLSVSPDTLSYRDSTVLNPQIATFTAIHSGGAGKTVELYDASDDSLVATMTDAGNGIYTYDYASQGVGDIEYYAKSGSLVTQSFVVHDYYFCVSGSQTHSTGSTMGWYKMLDISNIGDFEVTGEISATTNNGFGISLRETDDTVDEGYARVQVDNGGTTGIYHKNDGTTIYAPNSQSYSANAWRTFKFTYVNGVLKITDNYNTDWTPSNPITPVYLGIQCWNSNKTVNYRNVIVKPIKSINIDVDNPVLSYADSTQANPQIATLTATLNPVQSGKTVQIYKDGVLVATEQTDSQGQVSYEYTSQGVGDVEFEFKCNLVTETFVVEDCIRYDSNSYLGDAGTSTKTVTLNYALPSTFKLEYEYKLTSLSGANSSLLWIGESNSRAILMNRISGNDTIYKVWVRTSSTGSGDLKHDGSSITVSNDFQKLFCTYDGSTFNFNDDVTVTNLNGVSLSKIVQLTGSHQTSQQGIIRNIKIKPL